jgi:hypothetical protein
MEPVEENQLPGGSKYNTGVGSPLAKTHTPLNLEEPLPWGSTDAVQSSTVQPLHSWTQPGSRSLHHMVPCTPTTQPPCCHRIDQQGTGALCRSCSSSRFHTARR